MTKSGSGTAGSASVLDLVSLSRACQNSWRRPRSRWDMVGTFALVSGHTPLSWHLEKRDRRDLRSVRVGPTRAPIDDDISDDPDDSCTSNNAHDSPKTTLLCLVTRSARSWQCGGQGSNARPGNDAANMRPNRQNR
jgi:hypothetical protein